MESRVIGMVWYMGGISAMMSKTTLDALEDERCSRWESVHAESGVRE